MNRLQLAQRLNQEIGGDSAYPSATTSQTGEMQRYVNWIDQAWLDIQLAKRSWRWMVQKATSIESIAPGETSIQLEGADEDFDWLLPFDPNGRPNVEFFRSSLGVSDSYPVELLPWSEFDGYYNSGRFNASSGRAQFCSIGPDGYLHFFPKADVAYSLNYQYRRTVQALTADIDIPLMPVKFHMLIVWLALAYYGGSADSNSRILAMNGTTLDASGPSTRIGSMFRSLCKEQMGAVSYFGSR